MLGVNTSTRQTAFILIISVQFVDVVFGFPDIVLGSPAQYLHLHGGANQMTILIPGTSFISII